MKLQNVTFKWNIQQFLALSCFLLITVYYTLLTFYGRSMLTAVATQLMLVFPPFVAYSLVFSLVFILPMYLKRRMVLYSKPPIRSTIVLFSFYVVVIFGSFWFYWSKAGIKSAWHSILSSNILAEYHIAIFLIPTLLLLGTLQYCVMRFGNAMEFIGDFKSFPLLSPVFCFGAPAFWTKSLSSMGLNSASIRIASVLSFCCGLLFVIGIVLFHLLKNLQRPYKATAFSENIAEPLLILPDSVETTDTKKTFRVRLLGAICLAIILLGLSLLVTVAFDLAYLIWVRLFYDDLEKY